MVDIHSHILYGIDDGARNLEESLDMLTQARKVGYEVIVCTSHHPGGDESLRAARYEELKTSAKGLGIDLYLGREVMVTPETLNDIMGHRVDSLGKSRYLLVEFQLGTIYRSALAAMKKVIEAGYIPVVAHVERYGYNREQLLNMKKLGSVLQMNVRAATTGKSKWISWIREGVVDILATDSHRSFGRSYELISKLETLKSLLGDKKIYRLTTENPQKIIKNEKLTPYNEQQRIGR